MTLDILSSESIGFWSLICVALVYFMQGGFAMVETGLTRAKNAGNIIMKNMMDFCIGTVAFMILGYSLCMGEDAGGFIGKPLNLWNDFYQLNWSSMVFNLMFCATAATIVSGAMAERTKFSAYCVYSFVISLVVYPVEAHWIWGGGWLSKLGFVDFAGSTAVHMCGGISALVGAAIVGPRLGKYTKDKNGKKIANAIPGHSIPLAAIGVFILWFCWYGFNGAATTTVKEAGEVFATTSVAAAFATVATMLFTWIKNGKPDVSMTLNGSLAGLVAITAGCANVDIVGAAIIGSAAGIVVDLAVEFFDKKVCIDDPVGAISVHGCCGSMGTLLVGLFDTENGLLYGGGVRLLGVQALGIITVAAWVTVTMIITFNVVKKTIGLRASKTEEIDGMDIHEHGLVSAYADFMPATNWLAAPAVDAPTPAAVPAGVPVVHIKEKKPETGDGAKYTKITIICNQTKFEQLKAEMAAIGVTGMTVTQVMGCGVQKGKTEYYRGTPVSMNLLPKLQVDIVVSTVDPALVVSTAKDALYTGHIGDGKIFVYDVKNAIRVRTGEEGVAALTGDE